MFKIFFSQILQQNATATYEFNMCENRFKSKKMTQGISSYSTPKSFVLQIFFFSCKNLKTLITYSNISIFSLVLKCFYFILSWCEFSFYNIKQIYGSPGICSDHYGQFYQPSKSVEIDLFSSIKFIWLHSNNYRWKLQFSWANRNCFTSSKIIVFI